MNHFRVLAMGTILTFAWMSGAQQSAGKDGQQHAQPAGQGAVEQHLQMLSERLDLKAEQQAQIRPILQRMLDERQKVTQDSSLSDEAREEKEKSVFDKADKQVRKFLNDEQKKKLDQLEQESHPGMRGNSGGTTSPQ